MSLCAMIDGRSSRGRSALSNDPLKLSGIDGRSRGGRRFRDLMRGYAAELGGLEKVSEPQRALCAQAATLQVQVEALQSRVVAGDAVDPELLVRTGNVQLRALAALGLRKGSKPADGASALQSYLAQLANREDDAEAGDP
jgi:hypothetical protein